MKKLIAIIAVCVTLFSMFPQHVSGSSTGYFVVTAYYSPLPNQSAYIMGSYEAEIRMNGRGTHGASGRPVFSGMLAAPKTYGFGTKIYLEGLGIGEVTDRGGAIVSAGQRGFKHDRIDVWMGHGEEGLRRAMYWGNRTVKGYITKSSTQTTINTKNHPAPVWATAGLKKVSNIYHTGIGLHSDIATVKKLQELLTTTNFYDGKIDGDYNSIMSVIYHFQLENNLVVDENTFGAGYWGNLTRSLFLKKYLNGTFNAPLQKKTIENINERPSESEILSEEKEVAPEINVFEKALTSEGEFKKLQEILIEIGLYEGEINGNYNSIKNIILEYQIGKLLVVDKNAIGAGVYGPKTRATLKKDYQDFQEEMLRQETKKQEMEDRKAELEEKFKELEKLAKQEAESKLSSIGLLQQGDVSPAVRDLQNILKELGYFEHKDTAIYGTKTKQSVFEYQVDRGLITTQSDIGAGICGPVTKGKIAEDLKNNALENLLFQNEIASEELSELGIMTF